MRLCHLRLWNGDGENKWLDTKDGIIRYMIIRLTVKLAKKIGEKPGPLRPLNENPFTDWTARLFRVKGVQYIMITNTASLYSTIMFGSAITSDSKFIKRVLSSLREFLTADGHQFIYERFIVPSTGSILFSSALNRSVTGSMNDLVLQAKSILAGGLVSPFDASFKINDTPLSYLQYSRPKKVFSQMKMDLEHPTRA